MKSHQESINLFGLGLKILKILNTLPVYDDRYIKTKIKTYELNVPEHDIECKSFAVISVDSLLVCNSKYYLQGCLDNCAYKIVNKQMTDYFDENLFED